MLYKYYDNPIKFVLLLFYFTNEKLMHSKFKALGHSNVIGRNTGCIPGRTRFES